MCAKRHVMYSADVSLGLLGRVFSFVLSEPLIVRI